MVVLEAGQTSGKVKYSAECYLYRNSLIGSQVIRLTSMFFDNDKLISWPKIYRIRVGRLARRDNKMQFPNGLRA